MMDDASSAVAASSRASSSSDAVGAALASSRSASSVTRSDTSGYGSKVTARRSAGRSDHTASTRSSSVPLSTNAQTAPESRRMCRTWSGVDVG